MEEHYEKPIGIESGIETRVLELEEAIDETSGQCERLAAAENIAENTIRREDAKISQERDERKIETLKESLEEARALRGQYEEILEGMVAEIKEYRARLARFEENFIKTFKKE
jgi:hypothetical protein